MKSMMAASLMHLCHLVTTIQCTDFLLSRSAHQIESHYFSWPETLFFKFEPPAGTALWNRSDHLVCSWVWVSSCISGERMAHYAWNEVRNMQCCLRQLENSYRVILYRAHGILSGYHYKRIQLSNTEIMRARRKSRDSSESRSVLFFFFCCRFYLYFLVAATAASSIVGEFPDSSIYLKSWENFAR